MASTYKILGQVAPSITTDTDLYTVPAGTQAVCSTLTVCNRGGSTTFYVMVVPSGDTVSDENYLIYNVGINASDTLFFTIGITLNTGDKIVVNSSSSTLTFNLFGTEVA